MNWLFKRKFFLQNSKQIKYDVKQIFKELLYLKKIPSFVINNKYIIE